MSIPLAILWHQHQPFYKDLSTGELLLPWVRLHGVKDYYGMARLVEQFPGMACTINLVPSLLIQLQEYAENRAQDPFLRRTEMPAADLAAADIHFIADHFFMAQWDRMIRVHPRYRELLELRRFGRRSAERAAQDFSERDLRDLQVWFNLAWFHPVSFEESEALRELRRKGRDFSEADKAEVMRAQREILARIIPLHAELAKRQQVELTTTPFYHPILPLLCDVRSARVAMPRVPMPNAMRPLPEDAEAQVRKAVELHTRCFGQAPRGMWPAEGSVSPEIIPILLRHKIEWIATDEAILSASLGVGLRGGFGGLDRPELLYQPWNVSADGKQLGMVFRDHEFSDLIGFQYQSWDGEAAAMDLLNRIEKSAGHAPAGDQTLVSIILDGENCWEHYPDQGLKFLRTLYGRLQDRHKSVAPVRVGDFLAEHPPRRSVDKLFSGSWINHDFYIWIGHTEDRKAWEYIARVREDLERETIQRTGQAALDERAPEPLQKAWEELYIAEGSDWFWWYGDDHSSGNDEAFDRLFRTHLKNVYAFLGLPSPLFLEEPIKTYRSSAKCSFPTALLNVVVDGKASSYFEWMGAGRFRTDQEGGVMTAATAPLLHQVFYGYDRAHLCVRVDFPEEPMPAGGAPVAEDLTGVRRISLLFAEPHEMAVEVECGPPLALRYSGPWAGGQDGAQAAWKEILEIQIPFKSLGVEPGKRIAFYLEAHTNDGRKERFPRLTPLQFVIPNPEAEQYDWMV